jgi:hypothetical protein
LAAYTADGKRLDYFSSPANQLPRGPIRLTLRDAEEVRPIIERERRQVK